MKTTKSNIVNSATYDCAVRSGLSRHLPAAALALAVLLAGAAPLRAGNLYVPNYSFASPDIGTNSPYAAPVLDSWEALPQPDWYVPEDFYNTPWADYTGTFYNVGNFTNDVATNTSYIDNCVGVQAAYLFAIPQVAISQVIGATFNAGKTYALTVGLIGGGGDMALGSTAQLSLYYLDGSGNMVTVAATIVTNTVENFPTNTHFVDFQVQVPGVNETDPWAGQNIGIQLLATPDPYDPTQWGGYWDADDVRLVEGIYVPNYSFASPDIGTNSPYAAPVLDSWEASPQPDWYDPEDFYNTPWADYAGTFYNVGNFTNDVATNTSYIDNCVGVQAAYLFAIPQVSISQVIGATFNAGKAYTLTAGLIGGGGDMASGSTLQLSLYYLDGSGKMVTVAATTVTNMVENFPANTHFVDFQVQVPGVNATDPWAGQNIGIQLLATPDFDDPASWGGYWDADNVRLVETTALNLVNPSITGGQLQFTVQSEPNAVFQILAATNLTLPMTNWTSLATLTNATGSLPFVDPSAALGQRYYTARPLP